MKTVGMGAGPAQETDLEKENKILKERVETLEKENRELKKASGKTAAGKKKQTGGELPTPAGDKTEK